MERLLAVVALLAVSLLSFNTQRADHEVGQSLIYEEVESIGADLVESTFEEISALEFDADPDPGALTDLTNEAQFGGKAAWDDATDLDDLDGMTVTREVAGAEGGVFRFHLAAEVSYVEKDGGRWEEVNMRTWFKQVTLTATDSLEFDATLQGVYAAEGL